MIQGFSVTRRNYGHWDITNREHGRLFRVRGGPGHWQIFDERREGRLEHIPRFGSQCAAMSFICSALMHENIVVDGVEQNTIESWNIPAPYET
tara:strand:+ start:923 stop:1201 length:279 start_codon:yes stop_codon:yes gene_type:complete